MTEKGSMSGEEKNGLFSIVLMIKKIIPTKPVSFQDPSKIMAQKAPGRNQLPQSYLLIVVQIYKNQGTEEKICI